MRRAQLASFVALVTACAGPPDAPRAPDVTVAQDNVVTVLAHGPEGGQSATDVHYELRRGVGAGGQKSFVSNVVVEQPFVDHVPFGGVASYVVVAVSPGGEAPSPEALAVLAPAKPTNVHFTHVTAAQVTVEWDPDPSVKQWSLYWASEPGKASTGQAQGSLTAFISEPKAIFNRQTGQAMFLAVQAYNDAGQSAYSDELFYDPANPPLPEEP